VERSTVFWRLVAVVVSLIIIRALGASGVAVATHWWHERNPEPAACSQMITDLDRMRAILQEGLELFRSDAPHEKLEEISAREEDANFSFAQAAQLQGASCHDETRRELAEKLNKLKAEREEFYAARRAYYLQQEDRGTP
jgi:hypothetical protein